MNATAFCTIVSKNYLHYARTLMQSLAAVHPDAPRYVLLADELRGEFDPAGEPFTLVEVHQLPLPAPKKFLFRYGILELNTAVKPWFLEWLLCNTAARQVVYLDPDIYVYRPLNEALALLAAGNLMVLTPHLTGELRDGRQPGETDILKAGTYNLGFIGLGRHAELERFLHWWQARLERDCRVSLEEGLFVDQKWIDLAPGVFEGVSVLRHPGYNVAYWNLAHRRLTRSGNDLLVDGRPLVFFHFSGLDPQSPETFSKYQNRFRLKDLGPARTLVEEYCRRVLDNGQRECSRWEYAFGRFADGTPIPAVVRQLYRGSAELQEQAGEDPFAASHDGMNQSWDGRGAPVVTRLMRAIWKSRSDLQESFPDISGGCRHFYVSAFLSTICREERLPERFVAPVRASWQSAQTPILHRIARSGAFRAASAVLRPLVRLVPERLRRGLKRRIETFAAMDKHDLLDRVRRSRLVRELKHLVSAETRRRIKRSLIRWSYAAQVRSVRKLSMGGRRTPLYGLHGLNLIGYVRSEHGVGESVRMAARAAEAAGIRFSLHDFNLNNDSRTGDLTWIHRLADVHRHWINVFHINADQMPLVHASLGREYFAGRYNIGFWHWELPEFPDEYLPALELVDEVWAPSRFVQDAVAAKASVPVLRMGHGIHCTPNRQLSRIDFDLPEDCCLFLCMYDVRSITARKNPRAAVEAFRRAFPVGKSAALVIKINNADADLAEVQSLRNELADRPDIRLIDRTLTRADVYRLEELCDSYVSLHRSEGFGLGLAESMFFGRPVIGTFWSGNVDFMSADNCCPVHSELVRLDRDHGPYRRGQVWAEPDIDQAAWYMKKIVQEPVWARGIGQRGQQTIRTDFSPEAVGRRYQERIDQLARRHGMLPGRVLAAA